MKIQFYKCNANGNTFIIVVNNNKFPDNFLSIKKIKSYCLNSANQLVDGLIILNIKNKSFFMDYYNNDGTWETLCINGLRCASLLIFNKLKVKNISIICNEIVYKTVIMKDNYVKVELSKPIYKLNNLKVVNLRGDFIDSGAKHFVIKYDKEWPKNKNLEEISKKIRYNSSLFPEGTNVNFYKIINKNKIQVKTYEKGVESMMNSCASGSFACAYDYSNKEKVLGDIEVVNDGGNFIMSFNKNYKESTLIGKAEIEYKGIL